MTLKAAIENEIKNSLQIVSTSVSETYTNLYEGDYMVDFVGKVRKGDTEINSNTTYIDAMKEQTGFAMHWGAFTCNREKRIQMKP